MSIFTLILITLGIILANYILMGLPGAIPFIFASPLIRSIIGNRKYDKMHDELWPAVLVSGFIWPLFFPLWYLLIYRWTDVRSYKILFFISGFLITGIILSLIIFLILARKYKNKE
jgi:hypothetical protein